MSKELAKIEAERLAISKAQKPAEATEIRARLAAIRKYLAKRPQQYELAHRAAVGECEAAAKAGELWEQVRPGQGARTDKTCKDISRCEDAGFSSRMDATICVRLAQIGEETRQTYYQDSLADRSYPTEGGLYSLWKTDKRKEEIEEAIENIGKEPEGSEYRVVSVDPPWPYGREYDPAESRAASPYPEMPLDEIEAIRLPLSADAVVFLWTTHAFMRPAFDILDAWGLDYRATIVWDKEKMGLGATIRMQCEFCLLSTKGKPIINGTSERDIIREPRRQHSRKPEAFYSLVERMTVGNRMDYFSREKREGWSSYGAEPNKF